VEIRTTGTASVEAGDLKNARERLEAIRTLDRANRTSLTTASSLLLEGQIARAEGNSPKAAEFARQSAISRRWYECWKCLAQASYELKDWPGVVEAWTRVLRHSGQLLQDGVPTDLGLAHVGLARALDRAGQIESTRDHVRQAGAQWSAATTGPLKEMLDSLDHLDQGPGGAGQSMRQRGMARTVLRSSRGDCSSIGWRAERKLADAGTRPGWPRSAPDELAKSVGICRGGQ
jgi:tetratricopeptide (TPR) repeat protein